MPIDLLALGRQVLQDPTCRDFLIGDPPRPVTNLEMYAATVWHMHDTNERIRLHGCCGGEMSESGRCPESGRMCPLYLKAKRIERQTFHQEQA